LARWLALSTQHHRHLFGPLGCGRDHGGDRVERVEEQVGIHLRGQGCDLGLHPLALQGHQAPPRLLLGVLRVAVQLRQDDDAEDHRAHQQAGGVAAEARLQAVPHMRENAGGDPQPDIGSGKHRGERVKCGARPSRALVWQAFAACGPSLPGEQAADAEVTEEGDGERDRDSDPETQPEMGQAVHREGEEQHQGGAEKQSAAGDALQHPVVRVIEQGRAHDFDKTVQGGLSSQSPEARAGRASGLGEPTPGAGGFHAQT
jgi:hypothetical protein